MHSVSVCMDVGMGMGMAGDVVMGGDWKQHHVWLNHNA